MARRKAQQELTRDMIMDTARDLFVLNGYQHVSMRQIAKELGCSHGAIYYHFKNKAELFYALVVSHFDLLEEKLDEILNRKIENIEKLKAIMHGYIEFGLTHQRHYEIMFLTKDEEVRNYLNEKPMIVYEKFAKNLYSLSNQKLLLRDIWAIFISLHGFVSHYIGHVVGYDDVKDAATYHVNFLLKGVI
jgi:AcrR family transcriptional regulator